MTPIDTREAWLNAALTRLTAGWPTQAELPENVQISVGFPQRVARGETPAPCVHYTPSRSTGGVIELFVSPTLGDGLAVCRAIIECAAAIAAGRPPGASELAALHFRAAAVVKTLPRYPHEAMRVPAPPAPGETGSRYLLVRCGLCGYTVRVTRKWLNAGTPQCPASRDHGMMEIPA